MIEKLSNAYGPSAKEEEVRNIIKNELSDFYNDIITDNLGNLIIHKPGKIKKIAITVPMDEVSFIITHEKSKNESVISSICNVKHKSLQNILLKDDSDNLYRIDNIQENNDKFDKIREVVVTNLSECKANELNTNLVSKSLIFNNNYTKTDKFYIGKAMERSVLCSALCDIAIMVTDSLFEYYFIFTVQNYCDKKGAQVATNGYEIDELYSLCFVDTETENINQQSGPVVILRDKLLISSQKLAEKFNKYNNIQLLVSSNLITDAGYYQNKYTTKSVISIGTPCNGLYTDKEYVAIDDVLALKSILKEIILP